MAVREIRRYPDKVLTRKALPVETPVGTMDEELQRLIDDMVETMYAAPGIGLAAPQVGVSRRLIVVDIGLREGQRAPLIVLCNPEIVEQGKTMDNEEGCLSLPGFIATVPRAETVTVRGLDREGKETAIEADGLLAMALQHEIDHLNGMLILDRVSFIKREFFKKQLQKSHAKAD